MLVILVDLFLAASGRPRKRFCAVNAEAARAAEELAERRRISAAASNERKVHQAEIDHLHDLLQVLKRGENFEHVFNDNKLIDNSTSGASVLVLRRVTHDADACCLVEVHVAYDGECSVSLLSVAQRVGAVLKHDDTDSSTSVVARAFQRPTHRSPAPPISDEFLRMMACLADPTVTPCGGTGDPLSAIALMDEVGTKGTRHFVVYRHTPVAMVQSTKCRRLTSVSSSTGDISASCDVCCRQARTITDALSRSRQYAINSTTEPSRQRVKHMSCSQLEQALKTMRRSLREIEARLRAWESAEQRSRLCITHEGANGDLFNLLSEMLCVRAQGDSAPAQEGGEAQELSAQQLQDIEKELFTDADLSPEEHLVAKSVWTRFSDECKVNTATAIKHRRRKPSEPVDESSTSSTQDSVAAAGKKRGDAPVFFSRAGGGDVPDPSTMGGERLLPQPSRRWQDDWIDDQAKAKALKDARGMRYHSSSCASVSVLLHTQKGSMI